SRNPIDKFQLHYLSDERRFRLLEKGKNENDIHPQLLKGKQGKGFMLFESQQFHLKGFDEKVRDLVCERAIHFDLVDKHNLIEDDFTLHSDTKGFPTHEYDIGKIVHK
ncbi:hypothetical protein J1N35_025632, partial [Gossypium stocksii]